MSCILSFSPKLSTRLSSKLSSYKLLQLLIFTTIITINMQSIDGRKHHLVLKNDVRKYFTVSTFGFFIGGVLEVHVNQFSAQPFKDDSVFGFTLAKTMSDSLTPYLEGHEDRCLLMDDVTNNIDENIGLVSMIFDLKNNLVVLKCNEKLSKLRFYDGTSLRPKRSVGPNQLAIQSNGNDTQMQANAIINKKSIIDKNIVNNDNKDNTKEKSVVNENVLKTNGETKSESNKKVIEEINKDQEVKAKQNSDDESAQKLSENNENKDKKDPKSDAKSDQKLSEKSTENESKSCTLKDVKLFRTGDQNKPEFRFEIQALIAENSEEGLYSLFFHNCPNYGSHGGFRPSTAINLSMTIKEQNLENYLSAGEIPLPQLYFALSVIFFLLGFIWIHVIRNKSNDAFKIHYLMAALVFVKAFSLLFHGINYHFIAKEGSQVETWAVLYYITHLLKGALLFITIVLIGTGWAFIKHILSDKDKKIFMIVIPLQVLANIADIITEESEEGELKHIMWREIFILVDLLCCGAILFPVVWSIRHLQEASQTDGKAAINLQKLKLFRHFYVMIVCYIYFTRIIVYLLKITVPFQYEWLNVFFQHTATLLFFILTGYHFQPASTNPYFQLTQSEDDLELEEVLFVQPNSGFGETKKRNRDIEANADSERLITKRESSHDFD